MSTYTDADLARILAQPGYRLAGESGSAATPQYPAVPVIPPPRMARLAHDPANYRSKTEARFALALDVRLACGEIEAWWFEPVKLWLTEHMTYTPDFIVQPVGPTLVVPAPLASKDGGLLYPEYAARTLGDFQLVCYETKPSAGHEFDPRRALDRVKVAAHLYPMFQWKLCRWDRKRHDWTETALG